MKKKKSFKIYIIIFILIIILVLFIHFLYSLNKKDEYETNISQVLNSLENWKNDHANDIKGSVIIKKTLGELIESEYVKEDIGIDKDTAFCIVNDNGEYKYLKDDGTNCGEILIENINTPTKTYNGFLYSQEIHVGFSDFEGLEYYIKSTRDTTLNINVNFSCGNSSNPKECKEIKSTKNIKANIWYKVSGSVDVLYEEHDTKEAMLSAMVTDNYKFKNVDSIAISKIDRKKPVIVLDSSVSTTNSISVKIEDMIDNETDITSSICRYGTQEGEYKTVSMSNTKGKLSKCTINYKLKDKIYYYQICATDKVGNVGCAFGSSLIQSIKNPAITYRDSDISVIYDNNKSLKHYIKSSVELTLEDNTLSYCGKTTIPSSCIESKTKTILPDIWYEVSNSINVSSLKNGVIYLASYDGKKFITTSANIRSYR